MQARGLLIATVVLVALAGGVYYSNRQVEKAEGKPAADAPPQIVSIPDEQMTRLELKRKDGTATLLKRGAGNKWELTEPKQLAADSEAINSLTGTLAVLNSERVVEEKAGDLAAYGLNAPSLEVDVTKKDGKVQKLLIGDDTPTGSAVYTMVAGDPRVFTMASQFKSSLDKTWQDLRDKRLLIFDTDKLTRLEIDAKKSSVELGKNNQNEWAILKPKPMRADGWAVEELVRKLKDAKMDTAAEGWASATPVSTVKVSDANGVKTLEIRKQKDNYLAKSSTVDGVFKVAADVGTGLEKTAEDLRNKKLFDFGFNDPTKIEIKNGAAAPLVTQKTGEKWFQGPKPIDSTSLQNFVDKARDLAATKFVDTGFTTPIFEAKITSNNGKHLDDVLISKAGNDYIAKRENEPALYQLDSKAAEDLIKTAGDIKEAKAEKKK